MNLRPTSLVLPLLLWTTGCEEGAPPPIADRSSTTTSSNGSGHSEGGDHGGQQRGAEPGHGSKVPPAPPAGPDEIVAPRGAAPEDAPLPPAPAALLTVPTAHDPSPATYTITWDTTKGKFDMTCHRDWSPNGADRLYYLVQQGFYSDTAFFRVVEGFMAQYGLHGHPDVNKAWLDASIPDDPVLKSNTRGMVSFATRGENTRTTQLFISFGDNARLDKMGFSPVCEVDAASMKVVDSLYSGYGEGAPRGAGPRQDFIQKRGNPYLQAHFDKLDYIRSATVR